MIRELATAMGLGAVLAGAAAGQQSVGVSAVIVERVEAEAVALEVRSDDGGRLSVVEPASRLQPAGTRLLCTTYVRAGTGSGAEATTVPVRVHAGGTMRLERRAVQQSDQGEALEAGRPLLMDVAEKLTITRVIASNS